MRTQADLSRRIRIWQISRAAGHDVTPGHDQLHHYWVATGDALYQSTCPAEPD